MAAGDVLLMSRKVNAANFRRDPFGTFMCALIHLTTRSRFNHASLDIGDGLMVEATSKGVAVNPVNSSVDEITRVPMRFDPDADLCRGSHLEEARLNWGESARYWGPKTLEQTLAWATARVGWKYGYVTAALCGLRNMFPGWSIVQDKALICSQAVAEALERAGHDFSKGSERVSPGDLAEHFGVPRK